MKNKHTDDKKEKQSHRFFGASTHNPMELNIFDFQSHYSGIDPNIKEKLLILRQQMDIELFQKLKTCLNDLIVLEAIKTNRKLHPNIPICQSALDGAKEYKLSPSMLNNLINIELKVLNDAKSKAHKEGLLSFTTIEDRLEQLKKIQDNLESLLPTTPEKSPKKRKKAAKSEVKDEKKSKKVKTKNVNDSDFQGVLAKALKIAETNEFSPEQEFNMHLKIACALGADYLKRITIHKNEFSEEQFKKFTAILKSENIKELKAFVNKAGASSSNMNSELRSFCKKFASEDSQLAAFDELSSNDSVKLL